MMSKLVRFFFLGCLTLGGLFLVIVWLVPDPFDPDDQAGAEYVCRTQAQKATEALDRYAADHGGQYPKKLQELVPAQLSKLPFCRLAKSGFGYQVEAGKVQLTCSWHGQR